MVGRTDIILEKVYSLQNTMKQCEWNETEEEVVLLGELEEQYKDLETLLSRAEGQSDAQVIAKQDDLLNYLDEGTKPKAMPTDDRDDFIVKADALKDGVKDKMDALRTALTEAATTAVADVA